MARRTLSNLPASGASQVPGTDPAWWKFVLYPGWREDTNGPIEVVAAKQWLVSSEHLLKAQAEIPSSRWMEMGYEDYIDDPVAGTERITKFLDLDFTDELRDAAQAVRTTPVNTVTPPEKYKWRKENPQEIKAIMPLIRDMQERLGYPVDE